MASTRVLHRFRLDELDDIIKGDQKNQPTGGPIYFSYATHPEFGYLSNDFKTLFCLMDPGEGCQIFDLNFGSVEQSVGFPNVSSHFILTLLDITSGRSHSSLETLQRPTRYMKPKATPNYAINSDVKWWGSKGTSGSHKGRS